MFSKLKTHWPIVALLVISIILCLRNYTPGTWLSGWDTLHPEFNFGLAFQRYFFGVFRVEQGLGAVAGHSHMADLPRLIVLYISHFVLPLSFLRYFYIFLDVIVGTLGMYFVLEKHFLKQKTASFLGALFYLLNVGTIQIFNVPFEMFTTLFATLPFIFYFATSFLLEKDKKTRNLLLFAFWALLNTPSAYAATLWYMFFGGFLVYFFFLSATHFHQDKKIFKHFLVLVVVFLAVNLFWLVPNIYFVINHGKEVQHANINLLFSDQAFLKNKEFGNLPNLLLLKSFYFDWNVYQGNNNFTDLLSPFINYFKNVPILTLGFAFGISFILGALVILRKLKLKSLPVFATLLFCLFFLINDNFPTSFVYNFFQAHIPFFKEALRFPDDKILNLYVFLASLFFGYFCLFVIENLKKLNIKLETVFVVIISLLLIIYTLPSFFGNFINYYMKVKIPNEYFQVFDYLNNEPATLRVANLPIESPFGWVYYDWYNDKAPSYQGAGFLYFGIKQPLLDRDFDRWSPYNESYYREMSYAIYSQNAKLVSNVINKYKIGFILIDKSVIAPQNPPGVLYFNQSEKLIEQTGLVSDEKIFGNLEVFKLKTDPNIAASLNTNINVNPTTTTTYDDFAYDIFKNYITLSQTLGFTDVLFPFRDLIDNQSKIHSNIVSISQDKITLNPLAKVSNFDSTTLLQNLNLLPTQVVVEKTANTLNVSLYPNAPILDNVSLAKPIKAQIAINSGTGNLKLAFNGNELFDLNNLPLNTPVAVGKIILKNAQNNISLFDNSPKIVNNVSSVINPFFSSCSGNAVPPKIVLSQGRIQLTGKGNICIIIPYSYLGASDLQNKDILTNFQFNFEGATIPTSCLFDTKTQTCQYFGNGVKNGNTVSFTYVIPSGKLSESAIQITLLNQALGENTYTLSGFSSWYQEALSEVILPQSIISSILTSQNNISFQKIYLSNDTSYNLDINNSKDNSFKNNCQSQTTNAKKELVLENNTKAIKYTSINGSFCDNFSFPNLPHSQGYLVTVDSKNEAGLPLNICVSNNTSGKCDIYSNLSSFKDFDTNVFLLPPMDNGGIGYGINLENPGVYGSPAINDLSGINIVPIPYDFLENIQTKSQSANQFYGKLENIKQYNPLLYLVKTNGNPTVVSLYYSYEKGFKAYYINCSNPLSCFVKTNLAPFFGKEITTHVLVDNWANGWITDGKQIAIVFLPQYLEYLGLILIGATFLLILWKHKN